MGALAQSAKPILVATGFAREVRTIQRTGVIAIAGGGVADRLEAVLTRHAPNVAGILSYGLTGALDDGVRIGDWVVGTRLSGAIETVCDPSWANALVVKLLGARLGGFFADGRMIDTVAEKRALGRRHQALAVDMESHVAARVAQAHGLPFAIARIVSDEAGHLLPPAITVCMHPDGSLHVGEMMKSLAAHPSQAADVARTMAYFARGFAGLKRGARQLGPRLELTR